MRKNYKKAIKEQIKGRNITEEEGKQILEDLKSLGDSDLVKWFYQERKAVDSFKYLDLTREYTENQKFVNEQLSKSIQSDLSDVKDSLAVFTGRAYVKDGIVTYKE